MPTTSPDRTGQDHLTGLNSLLGAITEAQLTRRPAQPDRETGWNRRGRATYVPHQQDVEYALYLMNPAPLRARNGGPIDLLLDLQIGYIVVASTSNGPDTPPVETRRARRWQVDTTYYEFSVLDRTERELLTWHDQPGPRFAGPDFPHLHVSADVTARSPNGDTTTHGLDKRHLPTGAVTLAAVVRMLIEEFGMTARDDWRERLTRAGGQ